jgi:Transglutaminase-like superfamily
MHRSGEDRECFRAMSRPDILPKAGPDAATDAGASPEEKSRRGLSLLKTRRPRGVFFHAIWYAGNVLLIFAILLTGYSAVWEYSTRKYLKGFSDAIVPVSATTEEKAEAILRWMANGPARRLEGPDPSSPDRDPTDTLNYASLLRVCGTATNAFINLADSAGLAARRLLLLTSTGLTKHVVAEVLMDGRWIVVDPTFHLIMRGSDGVPLTREQLTDPAALAAATRNVKGYSSSYSYEKTAHVRTGRLGWLGIPARGVVNRLLPGWEDSTAVSLLLERESLAILIFALTLVFLLGLLRVGLRWYGERRLGLHPVRIRQQVRRAVRAFVDTAG